MVHVRLIIALFSYHQPNTRRTTQRCTASVATAGKGLCPASVTNSKVGSDPLAVRAYPFLLDSLAKRLSLTLSGKHLARNHAPRPGLLKTEAFITVVAK